MEKQLELLSEIIVILKNNHLFLQLLLVFYFTFYVGQPNSTNLSCIRLFPVISL